MIILNSLDACVYVCVCVCVCVCACVHAYVRMCFEINFMLILFHALTVLVRRDISITSKCREQQGVCVVHIQYVGVCVVLFEVCTWEKRA